MSSPALHSPEGNQQSFSAETPASLPLSERILSIDVLRGIGILGALFTSIWLFGGFSTNQQNGVLTGPNSLNHKLFSVVNILLEGKMSALICIAFGASMLLYLFKTKQSGRLRNADFFIRRQMWLIAFGLVNAFVFLWSGDILFHLGIMGLLLFPFIRFSARGLLIAAIVTTFIYCGKNYWRYADDHKVYNKYQAVLAAEKKIKNDSVAMAKKNAGINKLVKDSLQKQPLKDTLTKKQKEEKQAWEGLVKGMKYDPNKDEEKNKSMREVSYGKIWNHQLPDTQSREAQWTYRTGIWEFSSLIFLGMALFTFGFFSARFSTRNYGLIALITLAAGLFLGWLRLHFHMLTLQDYEKYMSRYAFPYHILYPFEIALTALGYTSLIVLLIRAHFLTPVWRVLAVAGRMALTNYLMQSVLCVLFFDGFGMGYFARLQHWQLYVFAGEVALVNIVFSVVWLRYFYYGPAEWLLRCLVYKKWLPNRKTDSSFEPAIAV